MDLHLDKGGVDLVVLDVMPAWRKRLQHLPKIARDIKYSDHHADRTLGEEWIVLSVLRSVRTTISPSHSVRVN